LNLKITILITIRRKTIRLKTLRQETKQCKLIYETEI
jgi:hypothetical protein